MLHEEVKKYRELSGDTNPNTPISRIGGYLDGYEKALEQESCEDTISREAVLEKLHECFDPLEDGEDVCPADVYHEIKVLPPVNPRQKIGQWIPLEYDGYTDGNPVWYKWECSECGWEHIGDGESLTAFCPNCGARMEVEDNG